MPAESLDEVALAAVLLNRPASIDDMLDDLVTEILSKPEFHHCTPEQAAKALAGAMATAAEMDAAK